MGLEELDFDYGLGALLSDLDRDGDLDLYVANDFGPNTLFRNDRGRFADVSVESGTQDWGWAMSATWADYDRDGNMDLYVSSMFSGAGNQIVFIDNVSLTEIAAVPLPAAAWLFGSALLGLAGVARQRNRAAKQL